MADVAAGAFDDPVRVGQVRAAHEAEAHPVLRDTDDTDAPAVVSILVDAEADAFLSVVRRFDGVGEGLAHQIADSAGDGSDVVRTRGEDLLEPLVDGCGVRHGGYSLGRVRAERPAS